MSIKKIIWISVASAVAVALAAVMVVQALTPPATPATEEIEQVLPKAGLDTGPDEESAEGSHALVELTDEVMQQQVEDGDMILPGEVPAKVQDRGVALAKIWVTFDSREGADVREKQLSKVIPNAAEWTELPAELVAPGSIGYGDPTSYAVSKSTIEPATYETWTFSVDGVSNVAVQTPVSARYFSGNGAARGTLDNTLIFQFKFDADGNLIEVTPPEE